MAHSRLIAAALRHTVAIADGEIADPESGLPHAAHAMCCVMFLLWMQKNRPDLNDVWKPKEIENVKNIPTSTPPQ